MQININVNSDLFALDNKILTQLTRRVIKKLGNWVRRESLKRGKVAITLKSQHQLANRILKYKKNAGGSVKAWIGTSSLGVHAWDDVQQLKDGVRANGEFYAGAWVNYMNSNQPLVWRKSESDHKKIMLVTTDINQPITTVIDQLSIEIPAKFDELLEVELNAVLQQYK